MNNFNSEDNGDKMDLKKMYSEHSLRENPPGNFRPDEVLIDTIGGKMVHGDSALDLSNKAVNSLYLAQEGFYVAAVAPDPELVADTASKAEETGANIKVYSSDLTALPFPEEEFDIAYDDRWFDHIGYVERGKYAEEVWRILKPGGYLLLVTVQCRNARTCCDRGDPYVMFRSIFDIEEIRDVTSMYMDSRQRMFSMLMKKKAPTS